ncbi:MAG TPA: TonB-dependent receptor [Usitatibacter sp.]|nr:TonB-dependent receptor [Usitatibacter sp.]
MKKALVLALAAAATSAAAQQTGRIEVTGSNIKRIDTETPSPVTVITREQIRDSGQRDVAELLRNVSAANAGSLIDNSSGSFSAGAQTVSLRGLGSAGTLVLVNGRRMTPAAFADPNNGNSTVYNINSIPIDAIDRIEILKDGASAIYGSDAMAGVVNLILRRDFRGAEASASYSTNKDGDWTSWRASATVGVGDLAKQGWNLLGTFEHYHRDPVNVKDLKAVNVSENQARGNWRITQSANGFPANYFREGVLGNNSFTTFVGVDANCPPERIINARCRYDFYNDLNAAFKQDRDDAYLRGTMNFSANTQGFGEFLFSRVKTDYFTTPTFISNTFSVWATGAGELRQYRLILPVGHPDNPTTVPVAAAYTFADIGRRAQKQTNDTTRALVGVKGSWGAWDYETGLLWMQNDKKDRYTGYVSFPDLQAVVADGSYRFDGRQNSPDVINRIALSFPEEGESSVTSWDLRGSRELMELAGGPLAVAAGIEARREELVITPDARITAGNVVGRGTSAADGSRTVTALYAEMSVPFIRRVETQLAVRTERYSDFGNSTTPKVGIKYMPTDQVAVRGTYAKGFRAPSLSQVSTSSVQSFFTAVRDPLRCPVLVTGQTECSFNLPTIIRSNTELQPEKSDNYTAGFILAPTRDLTMSVDYWYIKRKDQIDRFSPTYILARESQFPGAVVRDPNPATWLPGVPNSGPVLFVYRQFFNLASTEVSGVDVDASWRFNLGNAGRMVATFTGTYLAHYKYALAPSDPIVDQAGTFGGPSDALPRFRGQLGVDWSRGAWGASARVNYVSGWFDGAGGTEEEGGGCFAPAALLLTADCKVKPWTTVDLGLTWSGIRNLTLGVLVRNVADKAAPYEPLAAQTTQAGFNSQYHNALGRYFTVNVNYKFL